MSTVDVRPGDVLVFTWDGPEPEGADVLAALGANGAPDKIDIFTAGAIAPVGLPAFLAEGHGISTDDLAPAQAKLNALTGVIVVLPAFALEDRRATLAVTAPLTHISTFREAAAETGAALPIESESAKGNLAGRPSARRRSDARVGGMVAAAVLLFLVIFVILFVAMAG